MSGETQQRSMMRAITIASRVNDRKAWAWASVQVVYTTMLARTILRAWFTNRVYLKMPELVSSDDEMPGLVSSSDESDGAKDIESDDDDVKSFLLEAPDMQKPRAKAKSFDSV